MTQNNPRTRQRDQGRSFQSGRVNSPFLGCVFGAFFPVVVVVVYDAKDNYKDGLPFAS